MSFRIEIWSNWREILYCLFWNKTFFTGLWILDDLCIFMLFSLFSPHTGFRWIRSWTLWTTCPSTSHFLSCTISSKTQSSFGIRTCWTLCLCGIITRWSVSRTFSIWQCTKVHYFGSRSWGRTFYIKIEVFLVLGMLTKHSKSTYASLI